MGPHAQRNDTDTNTNTDTETEKTAGEHTVPHRFTLMHDEFGDTGFGHEQYEGLRTRPPSGCEPVDWGGFALKCERPGRTLLDAVSDTVTEIRREHGLVMNSLGIEDPGEWLDTDKNGYGAQIIAHLLLTAAHRASLLGYRRKELVRLLDAAGVG
ncbi:hypothetical protein ACFU3O_03990 [Streptomyces antibioticus]|uniref:hypothetical protein n=1 Tax=Streptomyces antibioticus TaxID=1890 RepID=UPI0036AE7E07